MSKYDLPPFMRGAANRAGVTRWYWDPSTALRRHGWPTLALAPALDEAKRQAAAINAKLRAWRAGGVEIPKYLAAALADDAEAHGVAPDGSRGAAMRRGVKAGSVAHMIRDYKASRFYTHLRASTQRRSYDPALAYLEAWAGDKPATALDEADREALYLALKAKHLAKANLTIRVMRVLWGFGVQFKHVHRNIALRPRLEGVPSTARLWDPAELEAVVEAADALGLHSVATAAIVNHWIGQREGDVIALPRASYQAGVFYVAQSKTGARVAVPHSPRVAARLAAELARQQARKVVANTLIATDAEGVPYTARHFATCFARARAEAARRHPELPGLASLQFMWLRHTAVTELAISGATIPMIAAVTGHTLGSVTQILDRYLIRTGRLAAEATKLRLAGDVRHRLEIFETQGQLALSAPEAP
jgi:hypothetical protein